MHQKSYLLSEFFIFFILLPASLAIDYSIWVKSGLVIVGFVYILIILKRTMHISLGVKKGMNWKAFRKRLVISFLVVVAVTTVFVWITKPSALFLVPRTNIPLFITILFVYTFLSVWPQEVIYRTFFFERYGSIFKSKTLFIFVNAVVFSLAHIFFKNTLVTILTFIGGLLFGLTYLRFRSTTLVSIEHALYGNWLFTVGMGQMLAFPGMEVPT
ncbi:MAG: CPBP family intramembrane metalloprotease [Flavobacteriaceae bacterium]|nr:CPBP family intramembrane metalloprotease [Flavobacteriaceae bacterium]